MQFSVPIYPNGADREPANEARVVFPNKEIKDAYIDEERAFCVDQYSAYLSEAQPGPRKAAQRAFDARRVQFAKHKGYQPSRNNPKEWIFKPVSSKVPSPAA